MYWRAKGSSCSVTLSNTAAGFAPHVGIMDRVVIPAIWAYAIWASLTFHVVRYKQTSVSSFRHVPQFASQEVFKDIKLIYGVKRATKYK